MISMAIRIRVDILMLLIQPNYVSNFVTENQCIKSFRNLESYNQFHKHDEPNFHCLLYYGNVLHNHNFSLIRISTSEDYGF